MGDAEDGWIAMGEIGGWRTGGGCGNEKNAMKGQMTIYVAMRMLVMMRRWARKWPNDAMAHDSRAMEGVGRKGDV